MIKVVFLIRSLNRGGTERQLATLVSLLDRSRFDLTILTFYPEGYFAKEILDKDISVISLDKSGRWEVIGFLWRLLTQLRRIKPHIVYSFLVEPNLLTAFLKPFAHATKIAWGIRASNVDLEHYDWFARLNFKLQVFFFRFADLIIFNSYAARDYHFAAGFSKQNTSVIHGGVDIEIFKPDRPAGRSLRAEWGIDEDAILIGLAARLDPMKDHPTFIKAAALVAQHNQDARFVCVGGGPPKYSAQLCSLAEENQISDRFVWAGQRDDMRAVYNALDMVCSSSAFGEGLPNAIAEAMACGIPCVVTDVGDSALLVGDTGIVVPPNNVQALADGLSKCIDMLRSGQTANPRLRITENFDSVSMAKRTDAALTSLIQR
jgi:glycosyltransferase involved in cell wall biosynthesis